MTGRRTTQTEVLNLLSAEPEKWFKVKLLHKQFPNLKNFNCYVYHHLVRKGYVEKDGAGSIRFVTFPIQEVLVSSGGNIVNLFDLPRGAVVTPRRYAEYQKVYYYSVRPRPILKALGKCLFEKI